MVTDGSPGTHYIDFKTYKYQKGNLIFIAKEQVHAFLSLQNNAGYIIPFTEDFLTKSVAPEDSVFSQQLFNYQLYHPVVPLTPSNLASSKRLFLWRATKEKELTILRAKGYYGAP